MFAMLVASAFAARSQAAEPTKPPAAKSPQAPAEISKLLDGNRSVDYARTKIFGLEAQGTKFAYVFDRSGSMAENHSRPLRAAKAELLASLNDLDERQQ